VGGSGSAASLVLVGFSFLSPAAEAAWDFTPTLGISQGYIDNVTLEAEGLEAEEWVTRITPGVQVVGNARRFQASLNYALEGLWYRELPSRDQVYHRLNSNAHIPLVGEVFGMDAYGTVSQQIVDPTSELPFTLFSGTENLTDITSVALSPYVQHSFGRGYEFLARYTASRNEWDDPVISDTESGIGLLSLSNSAAPGKFFWSANLRDERVDFGSGADFEFYSGLIELGIRVSQSTRFSVRGGQETISSTSPLAADPMSEEILTAQNDIDDSRWDIGVVHDSGGRGYFELRVGERFFGNTVQLTLQRSLRRMNLRLVYSEDPTTYAFESRYSNSFDFNPSANLQFVPLERFVDEFFVRKNLDGELSISGVRSDFTVGVFADEREFQSSPVVDRVVGGRASGIWRFGSSSRLSFTVEVGREEFEGIDNGDRTLVQLGYGRTLGPRVDFDVTAGRAQRKGVPANLQFEENSVLASLWFRFR
jgi:hypothetical protein